eukprot:scaffold17831_cov70-Phaeocystis_antarctica.AAC.5
MARTVSTSRLQNGVEALSHLASLSWKAAHVRSCGHARRRAAVSATPRPAPCSASCVTISKRSEWRAAASRQPASKASSPSSRSCASRTSTCACSAHAVDMPCACRVHVHAHAVCMPCSCRVHAAVHMAHNPTCLCSCRFFSHQPCSDPAGSRSMTSTGQRAARSAAMLLGVGSTWSL